MKKTILSFAVLALLATSCGEGEKSHETETNETTKTEEVQVQEEIAEEVVEEIIDESVVKIELSSNDKMQYDKTELRAKAGETVTLTLTHTGKMPKTAMGHNFVLLKQGTDIAEFAVKAIGAIDNNYIPEGDEVIAYTDVVGGGESTSVTFTVPAVGEYDFICSFPGHYSIMKGKFIVE